MTGRLKVYDADTGTWKYVDGVGTVVPILRYVPLYPHVATPGFPAPTANVGVTHTPTLSFLPANAVAVSLVVASSHTVVTSAARFNIFAYDAALGGANLRTQVVPGKVGGHYDEHAVAYVELGGDRQFDYSVTIGTAGTMSLIAYVTGYWTADLSTAIAVGGGTVMGVGSAFPTSPATFDRFFRSDLRMEFFWDGARWLSSELMTIPMTPLAVPQLSASLGAAAFLPFDTAGGSDIWLERVLFLFYVAAGTALSGTIKWDTTVYKVDTVGNVVAVATLSIASGALGTWRTSVYGIGALLGGASQLALRQDWGKTGTPGNLSYVTSIAYRIVAT